MTDPISFTSSSPRFGLPFLFAAQAQKEFFVNEAHALTDMLLHAVVEGEAQDPPAAPVDGECWLVGDLPTADWAGQAGKLAGYQSGNWLFASPHDGMRVFNKAASRHLHYLGGWQAATDVAEPAGGSVIDSEARNAIIGLIGALASAGIISAI
ncbi:hypothetical protein GCM10009127_07350 [Alteraurantiacibacter aestuarii]|uniref:DUF2793 domain-containing protein n=1 Tax=Alteraurantiacibacter aestuarii TaxID=650004 RepID=A0A844ZH72_9SPHN|nr:DUF2793 domain-containing protein [Alteraurantiacibacter aestuarii]MXO87128.1 DUF2793 domain-containing protein [Alteraurantiacibacter aestuarii]